MYNRIENVSEYLRNNGIKPSIQRIKIFQYLLDNECIAHPTVDEIFKELSVDIPTLSKTTVYNTLNLFVENHIVNEMVIEENEVRYDVINEVHGHFKCKDCGIIRNFEIDLSQVHIKEFEDINVDETHFYLKGTCSDCLQKLGG